MITTLTQLYESLKAITGYGEDRVCFDAFPKDDAPGLPFICIVAGRSDNFGADNAVYHKRQNVDIEVYTKNKSLATESAVEAVLSGLGLFFQSEEMYLEDEKCYEKIYEVVL